MKKVLNKETGEITLAEDSANYNTVDGYKPIDWKTPWNYDRNAESDRTGLTCEDPTKTQQHLAADQDINNILRKFADTGQLTGVGGNPNYQNIDREFDLQTEMVTGYQVQEAWDALPTAVRNMLRDPKTFADYVEHCLERGDLAPLQELGLAKPKAEEPPPPPQVATPAPEGGKTASEAVKT